MERFTYAIDYKFDASPCNQYVLRSTQYPGRPDIKPILMDGALTTGKLLDNQKGFPFNMEPPLISYKTLRAMYNAGVGNIAHKTIINSRRSWITPDFIWSNILNFSGPTVKRLDDIVYESVLKMLEQEFDINTKVSIMPITQVMEKVPQSTSAGLPYMQNGIKTKGDAIKMDRNNLLKQLHEKDIKFPDCAAFARSHIGSYDVNKVRPVWAYPLLAILGEGTFALPIIKELTSQKIGHHTAYGMEMMKGGMTWINNEALNYRRQNPGSQYLMTDYSSFDSTVPSWIIRDCFSILEQKIDFESTDNPQHHRNLFKQVVDYFINTTVRNTDGRRFQKDHGIPSGSMFTNIIGTMVNYIVSKVTLRYKCGVYTDFEVYFGDDALIGLPSTVIINLEDIRDFVKKYFGMRVNSNKSYTTTNHLNIHFLGYYNDYGTPKKLDRELFASMLMPQYLKDEWSYTVSRALGCLLASGGSNSNVFHAARAIFNLALSSRPGTLSVQEGIDMITNHPRMSRHLANMGCENIMLGPDYFSDYKLSIPANNCTKMMDGIHIY